MTIANNGHEALDNFKPNKYDIIFLDLQMPVLDGFSTITLLKERYLPEELPPIIALTANALEEDRNECFSLGLDDFLTKPLNRKTLENSLNKIFPEASLKKEEQKATITNKENLVNFQKIQEDYGDDNELITAILQQVKDGIPRITKSLQSLLTDTELNYEELHREFHSLKGLLKTIHTKKLIELCFNLENSCKEKSLTPSEDINKLFKDIEIVLQELTNY